MLQLKVKICGLRDPENIGEVEELRPHMLGFIFHPSSPRFIRNEVPVSSGVALRCGVFVDIPLHEVHEKSMRYRLDALQFSGAEDSSFLERARALMPNLRILRAIDPSRAREGDYPAPGLVDYLLFDNHGKGRGGTGQKFDWAALRSYTGETPYFLSGGIAPGDAAEIKALAHRDARLIGVDLNSRFELSPGLKSKESLGRFLEELRQ